MKYNLGILAFLTTYKIVKCALESYITGGSFAKYELYPHSILLYVNCTDIFVCGGSVLNQQIVLTAAHCMEDCNLNDTTGVLYGDHVIDRMKRTLMDKFVKHADYTRTRCLNDIALIKTKESIPLDVVKRIILMESPPDIRNAYVAGWGVDENMEEPLGLKHTSAYIQTHEVCMIMGYLPEGAFCAGPVTGLGAADMGDSGSALVIDKVIQVGLVSYKLNDLSLVVYTNVSYFLDWIHENSSKLSCENSTEGKE